MYARVNVNCPFLSSFNQHLNVTTNFRENPQYHMPRKSVRWAYPFVPWGQNTNRHDEANSGFSNCFGKVCKSKDSKN